MRAGVIYEELVDDEEIEQQRSAQEVFIFPPLDPTQALDHIG